MLLLDSTRYKPSTADRKAGADLSNRLLPPGPGDYTRDTSFDDSRRTTHSALDKLHYCDTSGLPPLPTLMTNYRNVPGQPIPRPTDIDQLGRSSALPNDWTVGLPSLLAPMESSEMTRQKLRSVLLALELERLSNVFADQWNELDDYMRKYEDLKLAYGIEDSVGDEQGSRAPSRIKIIEDLENDNKILKAKCTGMQNEILALRGRPPPQEDPISSSEYVSAFIRVLLIFALCASCSENSSDRMYNCRT
jgi:hypothetical protein